MVKGLVLAAVVGAGGLVAAATGGIAELRSQLPDLRKPFNEVNDALKGSTGPRTPVGQRCEAGQLDLRPLPARWTRPQAGSAFQARAVRVRAIGIELDRERAIQSELDVLLPPANYERPYSLFLHNRRDALAALERVQRATREKNPANHVDAARVLTEKK